MKTIKELKNLGFEENYVSEEESGDFPFCYLNLTTKHDIELISDDYHPDTGDDVKIKVFFLEGNQEEISDYLLERL